MTLFPVCELMELSLINNIIALVLNGEMQLVGDN